MNNHEIAPASAPEQARRRSLPRPVPAPPPPAVTHAPGNEVPADPAAASRCSLRSRLSLSASGSPRRFRRERGSRSALLICRRQPSRLRSLPVADHAPLLTIAGHGVKKQQPFRCCALLTAAAGRLSMVIAIIAADPPDNIPLCRSSPLRGYRSGKPCAPGGFT